MGLILLAGLAALALTACGGREGAGGGERPTVAVTTTVLGALVRDLVGDAADVEVIIPDGVDPHDFQPSARDVQALGDADLVVANGLGLEEGLGDAIARAREDGVPVLEATAEVPLIRRGEADDPHVWLDPVRMRAFLTPLSARIEEATGLRLDGRRRRLEAELTALDARVRRRISRIPPDRRRVVTGHESLAYYAGRYGLRVVGAVVPSLSSQAAASASRLAALRVAVEREGVPAVFTETGFPPDLADAVAEATGARVVPVATESVPEDATYASLVDGLTDALVEGLAADAAR